MPEQLIFTSAPTGIQPGRSGFQIVAQHPSINQRLVQALEKESRYEFTDSSLPKPVIGKHQIFEFGDDRYHVLSRIVEAGVDFTGRPNHLAHHLIFHFKELPDCPPAAFLALWKGWRTKWENKPRFLGSWDRIHLENKEHPFFYREFALPARTWKTYTDDEGTAALPLLSDKPNICFPIRDAKEDALLWMFFESQSLIEIEGSWEITFTNFLTEGDNPNKFRWYGYSPEQFQDKIGNDSEILDVFSNDWGRECPEHELVEKARNPSDHPQDPANRSEKDSVRLSPIEEQNNQVELPLEPEEKKNDEEPDFLTAESEVEEKHSMESIEEFFEPEEDGSENVVIPDASEVNEDEIEIEKPRRSLTPLFLGAGAAILIVGGIIFTPRIIKLLNQSNDPEPVVETVNEESKVNPIANMDPSARFANQLGEVDTIIAESQFLTARSYLSKYRTDPKLSQSENYKKLDIWFEGQKTLLEQVNRETGALEKRIQERVVIDSFPQDVARIRSTIDQLASDLHQPLITSVSELEKRYSSWLDKVRLKTENAPTFFIPIDKENPNPRLKFEEIPEEVGVWMSGLDAFPDTYRIEHIDIKVSPFKGLNQFELGEEEALFLTLWKKSQRSLLAYLDGQIEVIEIFSKPETPEEIEFYWRFRSGEVQTESTNLGLFPEPPLIINFLNTLTGKSMNVVIIGGITQEVTIPAEVPIDFVNFDPVNFSISLEDEVLREKLELFSLAPDKFLRLRSMDSRYQFAWDPYTSLFHLYESKDLESANVQVIQDEISINHTLMNERIKFIKIIRNVEFLRNSDLSRLGAILFEEDGVPPHLETFENYIQKRPESYFHYVRELLKHFSAKYTLIRPSVMEKWLAYPNDIQPTTDQGIITYRNLLLRTSKRFRSLLKDEVPGSLEIWRSFVTNLEFWLLGEHQEELLEVLRLSPEDIEIARQANKQAVQASIDQLKLTIDNLQKELDEQSDLSGIQDIREWIVEMTSLEPNSHQMPLILIR